MTKESAVEPKGDGTKPKAGVLEEDGSWTGVCTSALCGDRVPFRTTGWPTKKSATERILQHRVEHETGEVMQPLEEFRAERGLSVTAEGRVYELPEGASAVG